MKAFGLFWTDGEVILPSIRYSERQVRMYAIETEREYALEDEHSLTDKQLWKRCYGQGYRVKPVKVSTVSRPNGETT